MMDYCVCDDNGKFSVKLQLASLRSTACDRKAALIRKHRIRVRVDADEHRVPLIIHIHVEHGHSRMPLHVGEALRQMQEGDDAERIVGRLWGGGLGFDVASGPEGRGCCERCAWLSSPRPFHYH